MKKLDMQIDRRTALKYTAVGSAATLTGCISMENPNQTDSPTDGSGGGSTTTTARRATGTSWDVAAKSLQATAKRYNQDTDGIVNVRQLGNDTVHSQLRTSLMSGQDLPGFSSILTDRLPRYITKIGGLRDLSSWIEENNIKDEFVSARWPPTTGDEGGIYALPWDISPALLFYRRDIYEKHGIDISSIETRDDLIEEGKKLPDDIAMINVNPKTLGDRWRMYYWQLGGSTFTDDGKVNFANEKSYKIARSMKKASDAGITSDLAQWSSSWFTAFKEGTTASLITGSWMSGTLRTELPSTSGKWRVAEPPAFEPGGNRATNRGGTHHIIPEQTKSPVARRAWDYLKYSFTDPEMQVKMFEVSGILPGLKSAWDHPIMDKRLEFYGGQKVRQVAVKLAPQIPDTFSYTSNSPMVSESITTEFQRMLNGDQGPKKAVDNAAQSVSDKTGEEIA